MSENAKERIAAAALRMLEEDGSGAVSMRRVAAAAGVTPMAAYRHFPHRAALIAHVADTAFAEVAKGWGRRASSPAFADRFAGLREDYLDFALGHPHLYSFLVIERREDARRYPEGYRPGGSPLFGPVVEVIEQGMREGVLRTDDPLEVTMAVVMAPVGLMALYLGGRIGLSEPEFRALALRTIERVLDGVRA